MAGWYRMRERAEKHEPYETHVTLRATDATPDAAPDAAESTGLGIRILLIVIAIAGLIGALMLRSILDDAIGPTTRPSAPAERGR